MLNYYIYYRVDPDSAHTLEPMVRGMQARLKCSSGVMGRLLKKRGEENLWMEIYENVTEPEKFERIGIGKA